MSETFLSFFFLLIIVFLDRNMAFGEIYTFHLFHLAICHCYCIVFFLPFRIFRKTENKYSYFSVVIKCGSPYIFCKEDMVPIRLWMVFHALTVLLVTSASAFVAFMETYISLLFFSIFDCIENINYTYIFSRPT